MTLTRRQALVLPAGLALASSLPPAPARADDVKLTDDGLHFQPWFHSSFLDLREDHAEAAAAGKGLVVFWEQRGCPYCGEMHKTNLGRPDIATYVQENFIALQLNLYGSKKVTDFDGKEMEERELAQRWKVNFTPTLCFFPQDKAEVAGKDGRDAEAWRLLGYWKPFHFKGTFVYVREKGYDHEPNFQRWLADYREKLREKGENVDLW
ncbi:MAG: thioredoxin fold domain-containing protein [Hyphomicrobiaceae bacterium]|nr:thioredoxin fold domain-containing protein [Hyphomicrobiaceae bacterium]